MINQIPFDQALKEIIGLHPNDVYQCCISSHVYLFFRQDGKKFFACVSAVSAQSDGFMNYDEPIEEVLPIIKHLREDICEQIENYLKEPVNFGNALSDNLRLYRFMVLTNPFEEDIQYYNQ